MLNHPSPVEAAKAIDPYEVIYKAEELAALWPGISIILSYIRPTVLGAEYVTQIHEDPAGNFEFRLKTFPNGSQIRVFTLLF